MPHMPPLDASLEKFRFLFECHGAPLDARRASACPDPHCPHLRTRIDPDVLDLIIHQPSGTEKVLPPFPAIVRMRIVTCRALLSAQPDRARTLSGKEFQSWHRA